MDKYELTNRKKQVNPIITVDLQLVNILHRSTDLTDRMKIFPVLLVELNKQMGKK